MATPKKPVIPTDKKIPVKTKQVPAPAKKSGTVTSTSKKPAVKAVTVKVAGPAKTSVKIPVHGAKDGKSTKRVVTLSKKETNAFNSAKTEKEKGLIAAKAVFKDATAAKKIVKVVNKAAAIVEKKDGAKAAAPLKASAKKLEKVADKVLAAVKPVKAVQGIKPVPGKKATPAAKQSNMKKVVKVTSLKEIKAKDTPAPAKVTEQKPTMVEPSKPAVNTYVAPPAPQNKYVPAVAPAQAPAAPALRIPAEISQEEALKREAQLRQAFRTLNATAHVGS